jgi:phosphoribosylaminoimidazole-succinocarboxamide synthase
MERKALLYTGKSKDVYATDDPDRVILAFSDRATAFNAKKRADVADKGRINRAISAHLFARVAAAGVPTHLVRELSETELLCERVDIVPVEVVVRNRAAGSLCRRYGVAEGTVLAEPLVELFYKSDALDDPLIVEDAAVALGYAKRWELAFLKESALEVNRILLGFWGGLGIDLVDAKYEYGRQHGRLLLADELTPDGARLWDQKTGQRLDKDVFRKDLGDLGDTYRALLARVVPGGSGAGTP